MVYVTEIDQYAKFEVPCRHLSGDVKYAGGDPVNSEVQGNV